jgi:hypothetical protein
MFDCALAHAKFVRCPGIMAYYRVYKSFSVSKSNPAVFFQECLQNSVETESYWKEKNALGLQQKRALADNYLSVLQGSFNIDRATALQARSKLKEIGIKNYAGQSFSRKIILYLMGPWHSQQLYLFIRRFLKRFALRQKN